MTVVQKWSFQKLTTIALFVRHSQGVSLEAIFDFVWDIVLQRRKKEGRDEMCVQPSILRSRFLNIFCRSRDI